MMNRISHIVFLLIVLMLLNVSCIVRDGEVEPEPASDKESSEAPEENPVETPVIIVVQPNGDEEWIAGTINRIMWGSQNVRGDVDIEYFDGEDWKPVIDETENDGKFDWTVPDLDTSNILVRVLASRDRDIRDESDRPFTVSLDAIIDTLPDQPEPEEVDSVEQDEITDINDVPVTHDIDPESPPDEIEPITSGGGRETEPNGSVHEANPLPLDAIGTGMLNVSGDDIDYWKFAVTEPTLVKVFWKITGGDAEGSLRLENEEQRRIDTDQFDDEGVYDVYSYLHPGVYYIKLRQNYHTSQYSVWIEARPINISEIEPNNSLHELNNVMTGLSYTGIMAENVDMLDCFTFSLEQDSEVRIVWHIVDGEPSGHLKLVNMEEDYIDRDNFDDNGYYELIAYLSRGSYVIQLAQNYYAVYYELSITIQ